MTLVFWARGANAKLDGLKLWLCQKVIFTTVGTKDGLDITVEVCTLYLTELKRIADQ